MDAYRAAYNTWQEKTEWVQKDKRFDVLLPWGKHRADVLKEYIDHLESKCAALLDEMEAAEKRIAEQRETLLAARSYVMQCARMGDAHANGVLQAIDRAAAGKGE